jgi:hypothetical protein
MKKKAIHLKKLSLRAETVAALQDGGLEDARGGHFSVPPFYTCPECAPP